MNDSHDSPSLAQSKSPAGLYLVPTPIGNLKDITLRALEVLGSVDTIACEDTRTSRKLLDHYQIKTHLVTYHEHNGEVMRPKLLRQLQDGASIALISDAGTPLISDPGYKLVLEAQRLGVKIIPLPGPSAVTTALCASGLPTDSFTFIGFLPNKDAARKTHLTPFKTLQSTLIAYESPNRIVASLKVIQEVLGEREVVMARELTKQFEEILRLPVSELITQLESRERIKGEIVLLIAPATKQTLDPEALDALLKQALENHSTKEAAKIVAEQTGASKSALYNRALELKS